MQLISDMHGGKHAVYFLLPVSWQGDTYATGLQMYFHRHCKPQLTARSNITAVQHDTTVVYVQLLSYSLRSSMRFDAINGTNFTGKTLAELLATILTSKHTYLTEYASNFCVLTGKRR